MSTLPQPLSHCLLNQGRPPVSLPMTLPGIPVTLPGIPATLPTMLPHTMVGTDIKPMITTTGLGNLKQQLPPTSQDGKIGGLHLQTGIPGISAYPPLNVPNLPTIAMPSVSMHNQQGNNQMPNNQPPKAAHQLLIKKCPSEFLHQNPQSERQLFYNDVAMQLYNSDFNKFASKKEFHGYLLEQQKWRWDTHSYIGNLETRVHNLLINPNSGVAQNVARYRTVPIKCKSEDVKRCEATSKELENMATRIASVRQQLLHKKGGLLTSSDSSVVLWQNELAYIEQLFDRTDQMYNEVLTTLASVNQTFSHLQSSFTEEAAELADRRRLWRRRKENNRKRRKRMEKQLEKLEQRSCELLFHITSRASYDRVRSHPEMPRIGPSEVNLDMLNGIKSKSDVRPLLHLLSKGYLTPGAMEMISQKIQKLECGIKQEAHQHATHVTHVSHASLSQPVNNSHAAIRSAHVTQPSTEMNSLLPPVSAINSLPMAAPIISTMSQQTVPTVNLNTQLAK